MTPRHGPLALLLAALLLLLLEAHWAGRLGLTLGGPDLLTMASLLVGALVLAELAWRVLWSAARRLVGPARAAWLLGLAAAAPAWPAAVSLTSGGWVRDQPWMPVLRGGLVLAVVLAVPLAVALVRTAGRPRARAVDLAWAAALVALLVGAVWADQRIEVGHYPAFHALLALAQLGLARLAGGLLARTFAGDEPRPRRALVPLLALVVALPLAAGGRLADGLVTYTHGLFPKLRRAGVALAGSAGGPAPGDLLDVAAARSAPPPRPLARLDQVEARQGGAPVRQDDQLLVEAGAELAWTLDRRAAEGLPLRVCLAAEALDRPAWLHLALRDGASGETVRGQLRLTPGQAPRELTLELEDVAPDRAVQLLGDDLDRELLEPTAMRAEQGLAFTVPVPARWDHLANNADRPADVPSLLLREDGRPLGPNQPVHRILREQGGGRYSHWGQRLLFSTPDGSDPRTNGRRYTLEDPSSALTVEAASPLELVLRVAEGGARLVDLSATSAADGERLLEHQLAAFRLEPTTGPEVRALRERTSSVIVVLLDALRADHVGPRPDGTSLTPVLDGLLADGAVNLPTVYAPSDHTGRSVPAIATGLPLAVTRALSDAGVPLTTWLEVLAERGLRSFVNGSGYVDAKYDHITLPLWFGARNRGLEDGKADGLAEELVAFVRGQGGLPFAAYAHWSWAHVSRSDDMPARYAEAVRRCDAALGTLIEGLRAAGRWDDTALVVTADHGYALGEGQRYLGAHGCGDLSLRVPLVVRVPGARLAPLPADSVASNLSLAATVLDLLAPDCGLPLAEPSLLPRLLGGAGGARRDVALAATNTTVMLRDGVHKLTVDTGLATRMVFDLSADPDERSPLREPSLELTLGARLQVELDRERRLAQALLAASRRELAPEVLAAFRREGVDAADVAPLVERLWLFNGPSRRYLLEQVVRHGLRDLAPALEAAAVEPGAAEAGPAGADGQLLAVTRAWAGSAAAAAELAADLEGLAPLARRRLAELCHDLPEAAATALAPALLADALARWQPGAPVADEADQLLVLTATGLARHVEGQALESLKDLLVERFNAWAAVPGPPPTFACLRHRRFGQRMFLDVLRDRATTADVARVTALVRNRTFAERVPEILRRLGTDEARQRMLQTLRDWHAEGEEFPGQYLTGALPLLRRYEDPDFLAQAGAILSRRFPDLPALDG